MLSQTDKPGADRTPTPSSTDSTWVGGRPRATVLQGEQASSGTAFSGLSTGARQAIDRCLAAVAPLFAESADLDTWLARAAAQMVSYFNADRVVNAPAVGPIGAWVAVVEQGAHSLTDPVRVLGLSASGYAGFSPEQMIDTATSVAIATARERTRETRSDSCGAIVTSTSTTAQPGDELLRATTPLGAFARCVSVLPTPRATRLLIWQIDGRAGQWSPSSQDVIAVELLGSCIARAYMLTHVRRERHRASLVASVSVSQAPILPLLADGLSQRQIAERTGRSLHTVHDHVKGIYAALGIKSRHQLYVLWNGGDPTRMLGED